MVLSMIVALNTAPALMGTQEAIRQSQAKEKREEHRARRCNLVATCVQSSKRSSEIDGRRVVLLNNKLYIDTGTGDDSLFGHPFAGYYLPYPESEYEGLVSTVTDEAPILNWIYVDSETYEVKHGVRVEAQPNLTGPFSCTRQDRRLTFDGWEGFLAVEEEPFLWAVYFDIQDDGLKGKLRPGVRVLEIELTRKEKRWQKDLPARQEDQNTMHAADENQTMRQTTDAEGTTNAADAPHPADPPPNIENTNSESPLQLPSKGLDLRNADLRLGPSNTNHTSQSKELSQRLSGAAFKAEVEDDATSATTDMNPSTFSEPVRSRDGNHTPTSSVPGEGDGVLDHQKQPIRRPQGPGISEVAEFPEEAARPVEHEHIRPGETQSQPLSMRSAEPNESTSKPTSSGDSGKPEEHAPRVGEDLGSLRPRSDSEATSRLKNAIARLKGLSR